MASRFRSRCSLVARLAIVTISMANGQYQCTNLDFYGHTVNCQTSSTDYVDFDLSSVFSPPASGYFELSGEDGNTYYVNFAGLPYSDDPSSPLSFGNCQNPTFSGQQSVVQVDGGGGCNMVGSLEDMQDVSKWTFSTNSQGNFQIELSQIRDDPYGSVGRQADLVITCDSRGGTPQLSGGTESGASPSTYTIGIAATASCPGGGGPSRSKKANKGAETGWILIALSLSGIFLYVGIGMYMGSKAGKEGMDRVPQIDFWRSLPGLVKEGCMFTLAKAKALVGRGGDGAGEYASV